MVIALYYGFKLFRDSHGFIYYDYNLRPCDVGHQQSNAIVCLVRFLDKLDLVGEIP